MGLRLSSVLEYSKKEKKKKIQNVQYLVTVLDSTVHTYLYTQTRTHRQNIKLLNLS